MEKLAIRLIYRWRGDINQLLSTSWVTSGINNFLNIFLSRTVGTRQAECWVPVINL
jgi:hypothetical protein